jgi:methionine aminotransferase
VAEDGKIPATNSKLPEIGTTIFTTMSQMAQKHGAINLSQGFPDFPPPAELLRSANQYVQGGDNQYAPMSGAPALLAAIAHKIGATYGKDINPETDITVTSGATAALFCAIEAFVHQGDEVIIFDPAYDSYEPAIKLAGGKAVRIPLMPPGFSIDWNQVEALINPHTAMIIINSPHNPTGSVLSADDIVNLRNVVRDTRIILLSDEVYEHIVFDGIRHESLLLDQELAERSLIVSSFGKTFSVTGWKIGYCIAPARLMKEFRRIHQFVQFCVVTPMQLALADFLSSHPESYQELARFYAQKRDLFANLLAQSRFEIKPSSGTYFQLADYSNISDKIDTEFTRWMTTEKGVAAIPISVFYETPPAQQLVRFCFAKNNNTLEKAAEILCKI